MDNANNIRRIAAQDKRPRWRDRFLQIAREVEAQPPAGSPRMGLKPRLPLKAFAAARRPRLPLAATA